MKYMQTGGFEKNPFMRLTLLMTALFLLGLWITNFALYFSKMGLTIDSVASYYLGSEANYTSPRTYGAMLEVTHMHLPMMGIVGARGNCICGLRSLRRLHRNRIRRTDTPAIESFPITLLSLRALRHAEGSPRGLGKESV